jgi:transcriptional regulator with XRE-family HTH domain
MGVFADRLKTAMQQADVTSAQLAKQTGIGRSSISQWLSSKYVAKHDKVATLADALQVDAEWLLGTSDVQAPQVAAVTEPATVVDPELVSIWEQLDEVQRAKLVKKGHRLLQKETEPAPKRKAKKKKKKSKKRNKG